MQSLLKSLLLAPIVAASLAAHAGVVTTGEFVGAKREGFEAAPAFGFNSTIPGLFGGTATASGGSLHVTSGWGYQSSLSPHSGTKLAGQAGGNGWVIDFDAPINAFGGYFGINAVNAATDAPSGLATFLDDHGAVLGTAAIDIGFGGSWTWNGWSSNGVGISRVELRNGVNNGGFLMLDDLEAGAVGLRGANVPEPGALALAGVALLGWRSTRRRSAAR